MIKALYIAQCERCGRYPAPDSLPLPTLSAPPALSALRDTAHDAVAHAVKKGWAPYPLRCPDCKETT